MLKSCGLGRCPSGGLEKFVNWRLPDMLQVYKSCLTKLHVCMYTHTYVHITVLEIMNRDARLSKTGNLV